MSINNINQQPTFKGAIHITGSVSAKREVAKRIFEKTAGLGVHFDAVQLSSKQPAEVFTTKLESRLLMKFKELASLLNLTEGTKKYREFFDKHISTNLHIKEEKATDVMEAINNGKFDFENLEIKK